MKSTQSNTSSYERQNAVISYCFLGVFILLSRQERFRSPFIKSHARVATLIQFLFIVLIIGTIFSHNFGSMLIFDFSVSNIAYFIGFIVLLIGLGIGIIRALQGKNPSLMLRSLSLKEISQHMATNSVASVEKIPTILAHIPLVGNLIAAKYGPSFESGERFATWSLILGIFFLWIDPSKTLMILFAALVSIWIIYQSISLAIDDSMVFIGEQLPSSRDTHIFLITLFTYSYGLLSHTHGTLPHWGDISKKVGENYHVTKNTTSAEIVAFPVINIPYIVKHLHEVPVRSDILQGSLVTLLFLIGILSLSFSVIFFSLYIGYIGFLSLRYQHSLTIPIIQECSNILIQGITWTKNKSKKETTTFTS